MVDPLFSIIIPAYNLEGYIAETLDSVVAQTCSDWECICVDDESSDGTLKILQAYQERDNRFVILSQKNGGASAARNAGLDVARGTLVTFLDGDDLVDPNWLDYYRELFIDPSVQLARIQFNCFENSPEFSVAADHEIKYYRGQDEVLGKFLPLIPASGYVWQYCVRRDLIGAKRFPLRTAFIEDVLFSFLVIKDLTCVCQSSFRGYLYRQRVGSIRARRMLSWEWENLVRAVYSLFEEYEKKDTEAGNSCLKYVRPLLTRFCWYSISVWFLTAVDNEKGAQIRKMMVEMHLKKYLDAKALKVSWRVGYLAYIHFGWAWTMKCWLRIANMASTARKIVR